MSAERAETGPASGVESMSAPAGGVHVIVGAGVTGLTAACLLARQGVACHVLERRGEAGGSCRSFVVDGITFDLGPHYFFPNADFPAERLMDELLRGQPTIRRRFRFSILRAGRHWKFPIGILDMVRFPMQYKLQLLGRLLGRRKGPPPEQMSLRDEAVEKMGDLYYEQVMGPMVRSKALVPGEQIHHDWMARVDRTVRNRREPFVPIPPLKHLMLTLQQVLYQSYVYPVEGYGVFPRLLLEEFLSRGGRITLNCGEVGFRMDEGGRRIREVTAGDLALPARQVVWTGSLNDLNSRLGGGAPRLRYLKVIAVMVTFAQERRVRRPYAYTYYPDGDLVFNRIYYPSTVFRGRMPAGREGICFELNYEEGLDGLTDAEVLDRTLADAERAGLLARAAVRETRVVRLGECLPVYGLDYEKRLEEALRDVHRIENLYSVGRLGGFYFCMTPGAVSQGIKMAACMAKLPSA